MTRFVLYERARSWERARRNGNRYYTPEPQADYQRAVREAFRAAGGTLREGAFVVDVEAVYAPPRGWSKRRRLAALAHQEDCIRFKAGDVDNVAKNVMDALNGVAWKDDADVVRLTVERAWGERDEVRVEISVPGEIEASKEMSRRFPDADASETPCLTIERTPTMLSA